MQCLVGKVKSRAFRLESHCQVYFVGDFFFGDFFFTKYPRLKTADHQGERQQSRERSFKGKLDNLVCVGSFSTLALLVSWERQQHVVGEFDVFEFLLELTMDASMGIQGKDGRTKLLVHVWCLCFLFLVTHHQKLWTSLSWIWK